MRIGTHKTTVSHSDHKTRVVYHQTEVVSFNSSHINLDTGGWNTVTTKARMNQTSAQYNLGFQVFQKNFSWFILFKDETIPYDEQRITLKR